MPRVRTPRRKFSSPNRVAVYRLFSYKRGIGVGKAFMNIAKKESMRSLCLGNIHLVSSNMFDADNPPHIFYRKMGFNFNKYSKQLERYVDECIKANKQLEKGQYPADANMYYENMIDTSGKLVEKMYKLKVQFPELFEYFM